MECCIDHLLITEVSVPIPEIICFSEGSPKGISCFSKDSIGFPKKLFGSPKGVSQIRIRVCQMITWTNLTCVTTQIAPSWLPKEVKHLGSALVFLVKILSSQTT